MVSVTKNPTEKLLWISKLGHKFEENCEKYREPFLCLEHFPPKKASAPRSKILPYKNGMRNTAKDTESEVSDEDSEEEEVDDFYADPNYEPDEETNAATFFGYENVVCNWKLLLTILSKCHRCLENKVNSSAGSQIYRKGAAIEVKFHCATCGNSWNWCSSETIDTKYKRGPKHYEINTRIAVAILTTGNGYSKISSFLDVLELPYFSKQRYHQIVSESVSPAVDKIYASVRDVVMEKVKHNIQNDGGVNVSGDGQYDSRGYSAYVCRFSLMDIATKCVLDFETSRKARGGNSMILEKQGHNEAFPRLLVELEVLSGVPCPIKSFTSDRCVNLTQSMKQYSSIKHYYDSWHWIRSVSKDIRDKIKQVRFAPLKPWCKAFLAHIYYSIEAAKGNGSLAYEIIMSFFWHVQDKHDNFEDIRHITFSQFRNCNHVAGKTVTNLMDITKAGDKKALDCLLDIMTKGNRQKDLENVSPYFGTSALESFHSLANCYLPKEHFFDKSGYDLRTKLAIIHWNVLQIHEADGLRKVESLVSFFCKTKKKIVQKKRKTTPRNLWRFQVLETVIRMIVGGDIIDAEEEEIIVRAAVEAEMYACASS